MANQTDEQREHSNDVAAAKLEAFRPESYYAPLPTDGEMEEMANDDAVEKFLERIEAKNLAPE